MKNTLAFLFSIALTISVFAQTKSIKSTPPLSEAPAHSVGMSEERLALIDKMLIHSIEENEIPGAVAYLELLHKLRLLHLLPL